MVRKHLSFYGVSSPLSDEVVNKMAEYDVLITGNLIMDELYTIRELNPSIKIFRYVDLIGAQGPPYSQWPHPLWDEFIQDENRFIHETLTGGRLIAKEWMWHRMDISNLWFTARMADFCKELLDEHPAIWDGIFGDDCWSFSQWNWKMWYDPTGTYDYLPEQYVPKQESFHNDMINYLKLIKATIGNKPLIPNTGMATSNSLDYFNVCDGKVAEGWFHPVWYNSDEFLTRTESLAHGENLRLLSGTGKYYLANTGIDRLETVDPEVERQMQIYCLAAYLISQDGPKASFGWARDYRYKQWFPEMDLDVGKPLGKAYEVIGTDQNVYGRDYDNVKAFVNLSDTESYNIVVDEASYMLTLHSGAIIPWEAPPKSPFNFIPWVAGLYYMLKGRG